MSGESYLTMAEETRPLQHGKDERMQIALIMMHRFHGWKRWWS
jgi:hypothetical protein